MRVITTSFMITLLIIAGCNRSDNRSEFKKVELSDADRSELLLELKNTFFHHTVNPWFPGAIDSEYGGFITNFNHDWSQNENSNKSLVTQARLIWTASHATAFVENRDEMIGYARHGYTFLMEKMYDHEFGGFFDVVDRQGNPVPDENGDIIKDSYSISFAIYALAAYAAASGEREALIAATNTFRWLDSHAYDNQNGGYFNYMQRDGTAIHEWYNGIPPKGQNTSIHLMEAFAELYHICPDPTVGIRLEELLELVRDVIRVNPGTLTLYSEIDWTPVSFAGMGEQIIKNNLELDHISYGNNIKAAAMLIEASYGLALEDDSLTFKYAKQMVDFALKNGFDSKNGGFFRAGLQIKDGKFTIVDDSKSWCAQAEGLNSLFLMADLYPDEYDKYMGSFIKLWEYIKNNQLDHEYSGWYQFGLDTTPEAKFGPKGHHLKASYHDARSLMTIIREMSAAEIHRREIQVAPCD